MGAARRKLSRVTPAAPNAQSTAHDRAPATSIVWSVADVLAAYDDLTMLLRANPDGAFGYKASIVRTILEPFYAAAVQQSNDLHRSYQKTVPSAEDGKQLPLPWHQNGRETPLDFWCTKPEEFRVKLATLQSTLHTFTFPVRFTYQEVVGHREPVRDPSTGIVTAWQGIRGAFWRNLFALIDPPEELAGAELPVPEPTIDPLVRALQQKTESLN